MLYALSKVFCSKWNASSFFTEKLRDEWYRYEEEYEKLNQWIKDTETEMKADSELKATLEEKNIQLERQNVSIRVLFRRVSMSVLF